jgi:hypothetical protein
MLDLHRGGTGDIGAADWERILNATVELGGELEGVDVAAGMRGRTLRGYVSNRRTISDRLSGAPLAKTLSRRDCATSVAALPTTLSRSVRVT